MAKPEWGIKRTCAKCGAHFYDLQKTTFACPKCNAMYTADDFTKKTVKSSDYLAKKDLRKKTGSSVQHVSEEIEHLDVDLEETEIEDEDLIEDAEDLGDEEVPDVIPHNDEKD